MQTDKTRWFIRETNAGDRFLALLGNWSTQVRPFLQENRIDDLQLVAGRYANLDFLLEVADLLRTLRCNQDVPDISAVSRLTNLRRLFLECITRTRLDLGELRSLEECLIVWNKQYGEGLFGLASLRKLSLRQYHPADLGCIGRMAQLASLSIEHSRLKSLDGVQGLRRLECLMLCSLPYGSAYQFIGDLPTLVELSLVRCRNVHSYAFLEGIRNLRHLTLVDQGSVPSLSFIAHLPGLETLNFAGKTTIEDADLSAIANHDRIRVVTFEDRAGYSHKRKDLQVLLERRHGKALWQHKKEDPQ